MKSNQPFPLALSLASGNPTQQLELFALLSRGQLPLCAKTSPGPRGECHYESRGPTARPLRLSASRGGAEGVLPRTGDYARSLFEALAEEETPKPGGQGYGIDLEGRIPTVIR